VDVLKLLVLAGGFGTRLRSAVVNVPKALAPIGTTSFLQLQLENWYDQGVRDYIFLLHHQADQIISFLEAQQKGKYLNCTMDWLIEAVPMDTGGAVANAVRQLNLCGDFLVINVDTWLGNGMAEINLIPAPAIAVKQLPDVSRYGKVNFDSDGRIIQFVEKSPLLSEGWINAGLYRLSADTFYSWDGQPFSLERDLLTKMVRDSSLQAMPINADFIDIGIPEDLLRFRAWIAGGRQVQL